MIKYIGSKRALLGHVTGAVAGVLPQGGRVCDLFSGTARVGHALKKQGFQVWSNDLNAYAHALATTYVQADRERWVERAEVVLAELRTVKPEAGWFTQAFCQDARYFHPTTARASTPCATGSRPWDWSRNSRPSPWSA
jgi:adenine-specific DNA-methyltransferase